MLGGGGQTFSVSFTYNIILLIFKYETLGFTQIDKISMKSYVRIQNMFSLRNQFGMQDQGNIVSRTKTE